MCVEFKRKKQHNIGFPTFKLTTQISTKIIYDPFNRIFDNFGI